MAKTKKIWTATGWVKGGGFKMVKALTKSGLLSKIRNVKWDGRPSIRDRRGRSR